MKPRLKVTYQISGTSTMGTSVIDGVVDNDNPRVEMAQKRHLADVITRHRTAEGDPPAGPIIVLTVTQL